MNGRIPGWAIGAVLVPTAEWLGLGIDAETKADWVAQFETPPAPSSPSPGSTPNREDEA